MTARSQSAQYYKDKRDLLVRIFGSDVHIAEDAVYVGEVRYPVLDDVIVTLPAGQLPADLRSGARQDDPEFAVDVQTSFGDQWKQFPEVTEEHRHEFAQYFDLVDMASLGDAVVADLGCGSGRYAACAAPHCGSLVLVDFSDAIFVARLNLLGTPNVVFIMGDLLDLPFADGAFDFAYSLGVLHHLPIPALDALRRLMPLSPRLLVYLYYALDNRPTYFRTVLAAADKLRRRLTRLDSPGLQKVSVWAITLLVYWPLARLGTVLGPLRLARFVPLAEFYRGKTLRRLHQDAHDRFLTSIEQRVTRREVVALADEEWSVAVSDGLPYWHFLCERLDADVATSHVGGTVSAGCPVCGDEPIPGGEPIPYADIWAALETEFRLAVPTSVRERYTPAPITVLGACPSCGLRFFSPATAAGPEFYALLDSNGYFNQTSWEGAVVASALRDDESFVDFGCGDGALLRSLSRRVGRSVGVDHLEPAVASLNQAGVEAYSLPFGVFASRERGRFDVACAMQVVEHLPDVSPLIEACRAVLRPGGRLYVAVPNADRLQYRFEPLDCPPHHISRWGERDLRMLAARFGFEVVQLSREPGNDDLRRLAVRRALAGRFWLGPVGRFAARALAHVMPSSILPSAVRRLAPGEALLGHSLLAELRLPTTDPCGT